LGLHEALIFLKTCGIGHEKQWHFRKVRIDFSSHMGFFFYMYVWGYDKFGLRYLIYIVSLPWGRMYVLVNLWTSRIQVFFHLLIYQNYFLIFSNNNCKVILCVTYVFWQTFIYTYCFVKKPIYILNFLCCISSISFWDSFISVLILLLSIVGLIF
jgi:hypothetical protein